MRHYRTRPASNSMQRTPLRAAAELDSARRAIDRASTLDVARGARTRRSSPRPHQAGTRRRSGTGPESDVARHLRPLGLSRASHLQGLRPIVRPQRQSRPSAFGRALRAHARTKRPRPLLPRRRQGVRELDASRLLQPALEPFTHLGPAHQLRLTRLNFRYPPLYFFVPRLGRVRVGRPVKARRQLCRQPCTVFLGQV